MKLKYYLRGLGIGILVSTIILMIASARHPREMSDKEIIARAQELGMVMEQGKTGESIPKGTETVDTGEQDTQQPEGAASGEADGRTGDTGQPEGTEQGEGVPATEGMSTGEADSQTSTEEDTEVTFTEFTVEDGESAFSVCIRLYEAGLVDNAYKFNSYLKKKNVVRHILPRTIEVPSGADYEELAELLTVD